MKTNTTTTKRILMAAVAFVIPSIFGFASVASADQPKEYPIPTAIVMCESRGNYKAENPTSTASGAFQILDGTWAGFGGYRHAADAPKNVQNLKAAILWNNGRGRHLWECKG